MGYNTVNPDTLQSLLGSPPVATYDGSAVATEGVMYHHEAPAAIGGNQSAPPAADVEGDITLDPFHRLIASLGNHLSHMDFIGAANDLKLLDHHLNMGLDHWQRFVAAEVD